MSGDTQTGPVGAQFSRRIGPLVGDEQHNGAWTGRRPTVRAASLKAAIAQLREIADANSSRPRQQALVANLMLLRALGVDDEALDLVVALVLVHNVDEEMTAAVNYLASGFLLALLTLREEASTAEFSHD